MGGAGDDYIIANGGAEHYDGGSGVDALDFTYTVNFNIDLAAGVATFSGGGVEVATNFENIIAGARNNTLVGNSSDNRIDGREGNDTMTGSAGSDTFVFASNAGTDTITDFELSVDVLESEGLSGGLAAMTLTGTANGLKIAYGSDGALLKITGITEFELTSDHLVFIKVRF